MKKELIDLINDTILLEYVLPSGTPKIDKSVITTHNDHCYKSNNDGNLSQIIHDSIVSYSYDSFEFVTSEEVLFNKALGNRIRYDKEASDSTKLGYGFFGEVLLHSILKIIYKVPPLITKGHFTIIGNGESKGYDSYHLIEAADGSIDLWFGEVKFRETSSSCISSALSEISTKVLTDKYLTKNNLVPIFDEMKKNPEYDKKFKDSKLMNLRDKWIMQGILDINDLKNDNITLVYPILISFDKSTKGYDASIINCINYIKKNYSDLKFESISIPVRLFFIFLPVDSVGSIKKQVLKWIKLIE